MRIQLGFECRVPERPIIDLATNEFIYFEFCVAAHVMENTRFFAHKHQHHIPPMPQCCFSSNHIYDWTYSYIYISFFFFSFVLSTSLKLNTPHTLGTITNETIHNACFVRRKCVFFFKLYFAFVCYAFCRHTFNLIRFVHLINAIFTHNHCHCHVLRDGCEMSNRAHSMNWIIIMIEKCLCATNNVPRCQIHCFQLQQIRFTLE